MIADPVGDDLQALSKKEEVRQMGQAAVRNSWGKDLGTEADVAHIRRLAEAAGLWAVVPCEDRNIGTIRHEALQRFGCLLFFGQDNKGHQFDVPVPLADSHAGEDFLGFLRSLLARFGITKIVYAEGFDLLTLTDQEQQPLGTWDGSVEGISQVYADLRGLEGFVLLGVYDCSVMRRFAESRRPPPP